MMKLYMFIVVVMIGTTVMKFKLHDRNFINCSHILYSSKKECLLKCELIRIKKFSGCGQIPILPSLCPIDKNNSYSCESGSGGSLCGYYYGDIILYEKDYVLCGYYWTNEESL